MTPPTSPGPESQQLLGIAEQLDNLHLQLDMLPDDPPADGLTPPHLAPGTATTPNHGVGLAAEEDRWTDRTWFWPAHTEDGCGHFNRPAGLPAIDRAHAIADQVAVATAEVMADGARHGWQALVDELDRLERTLECTAPADPATTADRALACSLAEAALPRAHQRAAALDRAAAIARTHARLSQQDVDAGWPELDEPAPRQLPRDDLSRRELVVEALAFTGPVLDTRLLLEVIAAYRGVELTGNDISWLPRDDARRAGEGSRVARALDQHGQEIPGTWVLHDPDPDTCLPDQRPHTGAAARRHRRTTAARLIADALQPPPSHVADPERLRALAVDVAACVLGSRPPDTSRRDVTSWLVRAWWHLIGHDRWDPPDPPEPGGADPPG